MAKIHLAALLPHGQANLLRIAIKCQLGKTVRVLSNVRFHAVEQQTAIWYLL